MIMRSPPRLSKLNPSSFQRSVLRIAALCGFALTLTAWPTRLAAADRNEDTSRAHADASMLERAKFQRIEPLRAQGKTTNMPGVFDSIVNDTGGVRSLLADHDLHLSGLVSSGLTYNILDNGVPRDPQAYTGQQLTYSGSFNVFASLKIAGEGKDISQLNISVSSQYSSYIGVGPEKDLVLGTLDYFHSFFDRAVEINLGFTDNISRFVAIFAGGNPLMAAGYAATIPVEVGLSASPVATPTFNICFNGKSGFYNKTGVQRSLIPSARGLLEEADAYDSGLRFSQKGAKAIFINETGFKRSASPTKKQMWLRVGGIYNTSDYQRFDGGTMDNWALYALGDYQLAQTRAGEPYRGLYIGASCLYGPSEINLYCRYYEARVYGIGLLPGRPTDLVNLTFAYNGFSREAIDAYAERTFGTVVTQRNQYSASLLYSCHLARGIYLGTSVTYLVHPTFIGDFEPALNVSLKTTLLF